MKSIFLFKVLFFFVGFFMAMQVSAQIFPWTANDSNRFNLTEYEFGGADERGHIYVVPNEVNPEQSIPILKSVPKGIYISVGAERGFINFSIATEATHLLLIDLVPQVVLFNQMNIALLKISNNLSDYMSLRSALKHEAWMSRLNVASLTADEIALLSQKENFDFFTQGQQRGTRRMLDPNFFVKASYLRENEQYERLKKAADEGRMQALRGNLRDGGFLDYVAEKIRAAGLKVAALDISNAWERRYTGAEGVHRIVQAFKRVLNWNSQLNVSIMREELGENKYLWDFVGFQKAALDKMLAIFKTATTWTSMVYDQRFFETGTVVTPKHITSEYINYIAETERKSNPSAQQKCFMLF